MPTAFGQVILETVFGCEWMQAVLTNESFPIIVRPVTYKTRDEGIVKLVSFGQQQQIDVIGTLITKL